MNDKNYASLEASKRLFSSGIVLKTDHVWYQRYPGWNIGTIGIEIDKYSKHYPAPSMAEVWKELPRYSRCKKVAVGTIAWIGMSKIMSNENSTDALIDLLIYIKGLDTPK